MMRTWMKRVALWMVVCLPVLAVAQQGTVRGFLYEQETGEPAIFTPVSLKGANDLRLGAETDVNGYFSISKVPPGHYTLQVISLGFDTLSKQMDVKKDQLITEKIFLKKSSILMRDLEVTAEKREAQNTVRLGVTKLSPKQIERIPAIGGQADLAQYMQVIPGVVFTGDQGGQLYIRGGSPIMNKVMMDGMVLYNPFHSIGLFSVFDNDILRNADVYTGGFNAEYGGRISSVMDITTRDGNKQRLSGKVSASTFAAKALLEGPLKKQKEEGGGSSSFLFNYRQSYLDQTSKSVYDYVNEGAGLPFSFRDIYGKVSLNGANGSKASFFGFHFTDSVTYQGVSDLGWRNWGAGTNFVLVPTGSAVLIDGVFALSNYKIQLKEGDLDPRLSEIAGFNGGLNFKYFIGEDEAKYGIEILGFRTNYQFFNSIGLSIQQQQNTSELAGYFNYKKKLKDWVLDPGIRLHYYASLSTLSIEPRFGMKWNITDNFRFKASAGRYSQNLVAANSDRDVVNLFYGFLSAPDDLPSTMTMQDGTVKDVKDPLQRADHFLAGFEVDLSKTISVNIEGYYKNFRQVTNINRNKLYNDTPEFADKPDALKKDFVVETGKAYGADMLLKYEKEGLYVWAVYGLNYVTRWDGTQEYRPIWDRRHNVNLVVSYTFGKFNSWKANARWNYGSGFPFTQTQGFYGQDPFGGGVGTDITQNNPDLSTVYGPLNGGELPYYGRLDLGLTKTWKLDDRQTIQLDLSCTNTLDRQNIFYFDRVRYQRVNQLPLLPSIGFSYTF